MASEQPRRPDPGHDLVRGIDRLIKRLLGGYRSRDVLLGGFALLLLCCLSFTVWLLLGSADRIVQGVLMDGANRVQQETRREIRHFVRTPDLINRHTLLSLRHGRVQSSDSKALHQLFWDAPRENGQTVSAIYFGNRDGSFAGLDSISGAWPPTDWRYTVSSQTTGGQLVYLDTDEHGLIDGVPRVSAAYDPRLRPWYEKAVLQPDAAPIWTDVYANFDNGLLTLTRAQALHDDQGRVLGVAGVDLFLDHVQQFLDELTLSPNSEVFIAESDGTLIGSHAGHRLALQDQERRRIDDDRSPRFTRAAGAYLDERSARLADIDEEIRENVVLDGERGYLMVSRIAPEQGLDWLLGVFIPRGDHLPSLGTQAVRVLPLALLGLLFSLGALAVFVRLVAKPLSQLANGAARIAVGEFDVPIDTACRNEVGDLARAIDDMRHRLRDSFEQLSWQASHDALTGLVNRREFERRIGLAIERCRHHDEPCVLCYLDLHRFKIINDNAGHEAGDELLRQTATVLDASVRDGDTAARLGGDEFGLLLHGSLEEATRLVETLRERIARHRFHWDRRSHALGISAGLTAIGPDSASTMQLMRDADSACYLAKHDGRNRLHVHRDDDEALTRLRTDRSWIERIEEAFENDRFTLHAQCIEAADPAGPTPRHVEILLRAHDASNDAMLPEELFPAAERYDLAARLDRWVISGTLDWMLSLPDAEALPNLCAINLSGQSLGDETMLPFLVEQLRRPGIDPSRLCFELTETATIASLSRALVLINTLRTLGCRFALDDFGSGLSSFAYLKTLPVDYLKIDGLFVRNMLDDPLDFAMVRSINQVGQTMGMRTIAEYVESDAIRHALHGIGVDFVQGYAIGRPRPLYRVALAPASAPESPPALSDESMRLSGDPAAPPDGARSAG